MATLYTMVGLPGAGKSTFTSQHENCIVVCPDSIRAELLGDEKCQECGSLVFSEAHRRIKRALEQGHDVIFDATNVTKKARKRALTHKAYHVAVYVSTDVEECKRRNAQRDRHVPTDVIEAMAQRLTAPTVAEGFNEVVIMA